MGCLPQEGGIWRGPIGAHRLRAAARAAARRPGGGPSTPGAGFREGIPQVLSHARARRTEVHPPGNGCRAVLASARTGPRRTAIVSITSDSSRAPTRLTETGRRLRPCSGPALPHPVKGSFTPFFFHSSFVRRPFSPSGRNRGCDDHHVGSTSEAPSKGDQLMGNSTRRSSREEIEAFMREIFGQPKEDAIYWEIVPKLKACDKCQEIRGLLFKEKPEPVHPNCRCEIRQAPIGNVNINKVVLAEGQLQGFEGHAFEPFKAGRSIKIEFRNAGPSAARATVRANGEWKTTQFMKKYETSELPFDDKSGMMMVNWRVHLFYEGLDGGILTYSIN